MKNRRKSENIYNNKIIGIYLVDFRFKEKIDWLYIFRYICPLKDL